MMKKTNLFLILAGGKGKRLQPRTNTTPKPLLKVSGKSILQRTLERGKLFGFKIIKFQQIIYII